MAHPLETILPTALEQLRQLTNVNTVVGAPIHISETTCIIPVSRTSMGFVNGGGEYAPNNAVLRSGAAADGAAGYPFAGTIAAGVSMKPTAFLAVTADGVRMLPVEERETCARLATLLPELVREIVGAVRSLRGDVAE